ncbi:MAG: hypothetical protein VR65_10945 [Desulfobulbaceae bacterium BRH_c16a]|nr:MAG: hypothetical protein VR65_10945 [Desulfobulbaceae bacterium BRH_c16a]
MMNRCLARVAGIFFLGTSLLFTGGCGYKNAPVPPASVVPQAIDDLQYSISEDGVQLTWFYPVKTIKGTALEEVSSFELYRAEVALEDYCSTCPIPFAEPITLDGGSSLDGETRRRATYDSSLLRAGHKYFFKVRSRTSWWADSNDSNVVTFVWFEPAAAPTNLTATPADSQVTLSWQPATLRAGSDPEMGLNYQVLRSIDGRDYGKTGEPQKETSYIDRQVTNGQKYFYAVQTLTTFKGELAQGGVSKEVAVTPVDLTPPPIPTGVTAVKTDEGNKIFWDKSDAGDIGGYRVYRRTADTDRHELLADVEPQYTLYVDAKAENGVRYYYAVTAIDQAVPANESRKSKEATIR